MNDIKIILVGQYGVGKTSLAYQIIHNKFLSQTSPTVGLNYFVKNIYFCKSFKKKLRNNFFIIKDIY